MAMNILTTDTKGNLAYLDLTPVPCLRGHSVVVVSCDGVWHVDCEKSYCWTGPRAWNRNSAINLWNDGVRK